MAILIDIKKQQTDEQQVVYSYKTESSNSGLFSIDKQSGKIKKIKGIDNEKDEMFFFRASHKVKKAFLNGEFPDKLIWAS